MIFCCLVDGDLEQHSLNVFVINLPENEHFNKKAQEIVLKSDNYLINGFSFPFFFSK